jgi:membrane fusion protein (multidrug efflux system)
VNENDQVQADQTEVEPQAREPWPEEAGPPSGTQKARSYFRRHPFARIAVVIFILGVIAAGAFVWHYYSIRESTDDAQVDGYIVPIAARVGGTVTSVPVQENEQVQKGQVLVQIDPRDYEVALQQTEAQLADAIASARAAGVTVPMTQTTSSSNISTAEAALNASQKEVQAAEARLAEARANYTKISQDLRRAEMLISRDEISRQQYDAAVAAEQAARATVDAAQANVATAKSHVAQAEAGVRSTQIAPQMVSASKAKFAAAQATIKQKEAAVEQAKLNVQYTTVRAPFAGVISKRTNIDPGQVIQAGQPLLALVDLEHLWVTANFKETQLQDMRPGHPATIHVDAYDKDYKGYVESLGGATGARFSLLPPENATGNFVKVVQRLPVKIDFDAGQNTTLLRPGMSVVPTVIKANQGSKK